MADFPTSKKTWADLVDNVSPANSSDINSAYAEITAIEDAFLTDSTSLNASTDIHGFLPKLSGSSDQYMNGIGEWGTPASGVREILTADRTYYVRTDGNDANTGLSNTSGGAFLTIQKAIDASAALDTSIYNVIIQIADGTYVESPVLKNLLGSGTLTIQGNSSTPANVVIDGGFVKSTSGTTCTIKDLKFIKSSTASAVCIKAQYYAVIYFSNIIFHTGFTFHLNSEYSGTITATGNYTISGACSYHAFCASKGVINISNRTATISGTPDIAYFVYLTTMSFCSAYTMTFNGSATGNRYYVALNSVCSTNGGGADYFPGNAAGTTATGGLYV